MLLETVKTATVAVSGSLCNEGIMAQYSISVKPYKSASRPKARYVVNFYKPNGKRSRTFHPTKTEADTAAVEKRIEVENIGVRAFQITDRDRLMALDAVDRLGPYGATITDAVDFFIKDRRAAQVPVVDVVKAFLASREKLRRSGRHLTTLRRFMARFVAEFKDRAIGTIDTSDIEGWLGGLGVGPVSGNTYRALIHSLFRFAVARKFCTTNPVTAIGTESVAGEKVGILTPDQMAALLEAAAGDVRAFVAIGAFAGVRPEEELTRLTWEEVDLEELHIDISAKSSKTAQQRYVKILPVLAAWLAPLKGKGIIVGPNFRRRFEQARRDIGFRCRGTDPLGEDGKPIERKLAPWPHDALRHTYASYHIANFENAAELALQMGHESNSLIFSNYRHRVKKADAEKFWNLFPKENL